MPARTKPSIHVSLARQEWRLRAPDGRVLRRGPASTAERGAGFQAGSLQTPTGRFRVCGKFGRNAPAGMVFRARRATGRLARQGEAGDLITSRILWLEGLEPRNANTKGRFIYLHGTNHEAHLGRPASHGCVRLANRAIIELFPLVPRGAEVFIG